MSDRQAGGVDSPQDVDVLERELAAARERLLTLEREMERARSRAHERDFELASAQKALERAEQLLEQWRATAQEHERELVDGETRLVDAELRAERLDDALTSIRSGRAYKLMRIVWRLRRPFKGR